MDSATAPVRPIIRPGGIQFGFTAAPDKRRSIDKIDARLKAVLFEVVSSDVAWPLLLLGPAGGGKTCAALVMHDRYGGWFADLPAFHERLLEIKGGSVFWDGPTGCQMTARDFWTAWRSSPLTVLDEIGQRSPSDAQYETLKTAIDAREERPAIYISNLGLRDLGRVYDDRIVSRLAGGTVYELDVEDRRISKA